MRQSADKVDADVDLPRASTRSLFLHSSCLTHIYSVEIAAKIVCLQNVCALAMCHIDSRPINSVVFICAVEAYSCGIGGKAIKAMFFAFTQV